MYTEPTSPFSVSYIDIYTLSVPSAGIGSPGNTTFTASTGPVSNVTTQSCSFSSSNNTLSRSTYIVSLTDIITQYGSTVYIGIAMVYPH